MEYKWPCSSNAKNCIFYRDDGMCRLPALEDNRLPVVYKNGCDAHLSNVEEFAAKDDEWLTTATETVEERVAYLWECITMHLVKMPMKNPVWGSIKGARIHFEDPRKARAFASVFNLLAGKDIITCLDDGHFATRDVKKSALVRNPREEDLGVIWKELCLLALCAGMRDGVKLGDELFAPIRSNKDDIVVTNESAANALVFVFGELGVILTADKFRWRAPVGRKERTSWSVTLRDTTFSLPKMCYSTLPTGEIILIRRGRAGYYPADVPDLNAEGKRNLVDRMNSEAGIIKEQEAAMLAGSMFGWHVPAADPDAYDENGVLRKGGEECF